MVSERQKAILTKNGYTEEQIARMDYKQISEVIGEILAKRNKETLHVAGLEMNQQHPQDDKFKAMKVSYAKDLAIAMIHECALLQKADFRNPEVMRAITDTSILMIGAMWARL